jgi:hypothetical protein
MCLTSQLNAVSSHTTQISSTTLAAAITDSVSKFPYGLLQRRNINFILHVTPEIKNFISESFPPDQFPNTFYLFFQFTAYLKYFTTTKKEPCFKTCRAKTR